MPKIETARYAVGAFGANYSPADATNLSDWVGCDTLADAREYVWSLGVSLPRVAPVYAVQLDGTDTFYPTPLFGHEGDGAWVYPLRDGAIPEDAEPVGRFVFGPRGGITWERC